MLSATPAEVKDPIDVLFIDADKEGYPDYLSRPLPLVRPGGLILAHNFDQAGEYSHAVSANPRLRLWFQGVPRHHPEEALRDLLRRQ